MNADDLERQCRNYTGVPPTTVDLLVGHGHLDTVVGAARAGEWFCAQRAVRELADRGQKDQAWELLSPYVATGWWGAVEEAARLLQEWRRTDDALALLRGYAGPKEHSAVDETARLLASLGQVDEAIAMLRPRLRDGLLLEALVEATDAGHRDAEVIALLEPLAEEKMRTGDPWRAAILLARVLERAGRTDDAVALLREHLDHNERVTANDVEELASLLARRDRFEELYTLAASDDRAYVAAPVLVDGLVALDRADEAIAFLRATAQTNVGGSGAQLVSQLVELGRLDEAVAEAGPVLADVSCGCMLGGLLEQLVEADRTELALDVLDRAVAANGILAEDMGHWRPRLLSAAGRHEEAVAAACARPEDVYRRAGGIADALEAAGRIDEALAVLQEAVVTSDYHHVDLARLLILTGRPQEAVDLHRAPAEPLLL